MRTAHCVAALAAILASCGSQFSTEQPLPPRPSLRHTAVGVQVWNGLDAPLVCRVTAESSDGRVVSLAEELRVPPRAPRIDASLGDDPNRARAVQAWLPEGEWKILVVTDSHQAACAVNAESPWAIVHAESTGLRSFARDGRVVLD
jgi:hypothetical protein